MMTFRIGDRVQLKADHPDSGDFGRAGMVGTVVNVTAPDPLYLNQAIEVDFGNDEVWWQPERILRLVPNDAHTDADLAMALELANLIAIDGGGDFFSFYVAEAEWLRTEVRNALLERAS
jgi:hypothetical protein